ncbi:MAG: type II secretory pathway pseudopilin PulG [Mariniblastus sp.]|jgi:type II secretory pathway pseudopilin PulG
MIRPFSQQQRPQRRLGYTLIELLLALGLSVVVLSAISMAIQIYLISLTKQQDLVEQRQVARALLTMIENDLRAGIQYKPADYAGLDNLLATQLAKLQGEAPSDDEEEEPIEVIVEDEVAFRPTLLGASNVVMIDISRLPRMDQYNPLLVDNAEVSSPSDVKSLAYFVSSSNGGMESEVQFGTPQAPGGLYRREIDRAVASYLGENSLMSSPDKYTQLVAHEVAEIAFRYFDGEEWQTEWDSGEAGGFPVAIEVRIVIDSERTGSGAANYSYSGAGDESTKIYRTVVHLPVAESTAE